ncbi:NAD-dependent epimerase/dehydratase family protein [Agromyces sp. MMS24-JH15]|uniref:NAD-dependent epimerase/dehydratase family protein n=1 Tax=Agromyces sp. MMS24-JH15 TaxID=3243765 RepID=UPI0037492C6A
MRILLTGGTGYIGSAVLAELVAAGHEVDAVVRSGASAVAVAELGARAIEGDLSDAAWLASALADVDAAVHAAAPESGADALNATVVDAAIAAFAGTGKRFVLTSGVWEFGAGDDLDEDSPLDPPALVAWRVPIEERLLASGVSATVLAPAVVYGRDRGILNIITDPPRTASGALTLVGDGSQRWTWVHVDDLARLYRIVLEHPVALGRVLAVDGSSPTVREVVEAAAGTAGVAAETVEAARARFGEAFADALLLDQAASGAKARSLGWVPEHASVLDEVEREASAA